MTNKLVTIVLATLPLGACAPTAFRGDVGAMFPYLHGNTSLQNSSGTLSLGDVKSNLRGGLDVGEVQPSPYVRAEADWGPHRVRVHGMGYDESGTSTLQQPFGDLPAGTVVDSSLEFLGVTAAWSYDLFPGDTFRVAPGAQFAFYSLDVTARSTSPAGFEKVNTDLLVPQVYVEGEVDLGLVSAGADVGFMSVHLGDAAGRYVDAEAIVRVHPSSSWEAFVGYRVIALDASGDASGRDFDADLAVYGWFLGGGMRF